MSFDPAAQVVTLRGTETAGIPSPGLPGRTFVLDGAEWEAT
jgi:hypothetical protein